MSVARRSRPRPWTRRLRAAGDAAARRWRRMPKHRRPRVLLIAGLLLAAAVGWFGWGEPTGAQAHRLGGHEALVAKHARAAGVDERLVRSVVTHESGGDADAVSPKRARGLMQITGITLQDVRNRNRGFPEGDLFDPDYNLRVGTTYLAYLLDRFDGDRRLAVAAYHMGPTAVRRAMNADPGLGSEALIAKHGGPQTRAYVAKVLRDG